MLQMNIATLYLFYAFSLLAYCKSDIELRSSLVAVPQIQDSYDVVHQKIYMTESVPETKLPANYFVEKALKNRPTKVETAQPKTNLQSETKLKNVETAASKTQTGSPLPQNRKRPLDSSALSVNENQKIGWLVQAPAHFPPFVVENGVQVKLTEAPLKEAPLVQYGEQGKMPTDTKPQPSPVEKKPEIIQAVRNDKQSDEKGKQQVPQKSIEHTFSIEAEKKRMDEDQKKLILISGMLVVLVVVFIVVRSQKKKRESMSQLHSRFQSYREEEESSILRGKKEKEEEEEQEDKNLEETGLAIEDSDQEIPTF